MNRQRKRHLARMSLEEAVHLGASDLVAGAGSVYVEVHDHDNIQGLLVAIELNPDTLEGNVRQLSEKLRSYLNQWVAANPNDRRVTSWGATFEIKGRTIASLSVHDRPPSTEAD